MHGAASWSSSAFMYFLSIVIWLDDLLYVVYFDYEFTSMRSIYIRPSTRMAIALSERAAGEYVLSQ